ncbi:RHS repeat-associated core domain-containing protein, partial [Wenyingzhuangia sp. chi5]
SYAPNSNKLIKVTDTGYDTNDTQGFKDGTNTGNDYDYDDNGNMTQDLNKGIASIGYNHLNLPDNVQFSPDDRIEYVYDALGNKIRKSVLRYGSPTVVTDYAGNYVYKDGLLKFFNHAEGFVDTENGYDYVYQYKDHLGNVRLSYNSIRETIFTDGFESITNWDKSINSFGWSITAIDTSKKKTGNYSGRIDDNYPTNWEKYVYSDTWTPINNSEDTYYTVSGWIFIENIANNDAEIYLSSRETGETGFPSGHYRTKITTQGSWQFVSNTFLIPKEVRELNVRIDNNKAGKVWFDDVKIVKETNGLEILEENNYYPFGLKHKGYNDAVNSSNLALKKKFGGKELQDENILGNQLNWYDISARNYDPALGRWMNLDPLAEKGRRHSPYNYAFDNPIRFVDYDGMWPEWGGVLDAVQTGLDVAGMIPGVGNIADAANATISGGRAVYALATGDMDGAKEHGANLAMSLAAAVPGAGLAAGGAKLGKKFAKVAGKADDVVEATMKTANTTKKSVKAIGPAGDAGGTVMKQLPENMQKNLKTTTNKQGTIYKDPKNPGGNNVRTQTGNPNSSFPAQQKPYTKQVKNGKMIDKNGSEVKPDSDAAHQPTKDFKYQ